MNKKEADRREEVFMEVVKSKYKLAEELEELRANKFPTVDKSSWFYKNCVRQRKKGAKICQVCPFRAGIEQQETKQASNGCEFWKHCVDAGTITCYKSEIAPKCFACQFSGCRMNTGKVNDNYCAIHRKIIGRYS